MSSYTVISGDTFDAISRKRYGTEANSDLISSANPGVSEPLSAGAVIIIPVDASIPSDISQVTSSENPNEVALLIDGERFRFWEGIKISRSIDAMDTLSFTAPFDYERAEFKDTFRPFSYKGTVVTVGGSPLFTGVMMGIDPQLSTDSSMIDVSCYSLPGSLNDCTAPASSYPIEYSEQGVGDIAKAMVKPFGISVSMDEDQGAVFELAAAQIDEKILGFLVKLAQQRNLIISSTSDGELLFQKSVSAGSPVAVLEQGYSPVTAVSPNFDPQSFFSHVTGIDHTIVGEDGSQYTVKNQWVSVVRPLAFSTPDSSGGSVQESTEAKAGRMFGAAASYTLNVSTWRDPQGDLWAPNTTIKLKAPSAMVYNSYEFLIRSVEFNKDKISETAVLDLVMPGAFSGEIPEELPWD